MIKIALILLLINIVNAKHFVDTTISVSKTRNEKLYDLLKRYHLIFTLMIALLFPVTLLYFLLMYAMAYVNSLKNHIPFKTAFEHIVTIITDNIHIRK